VAAALPPGGRLVACDVSREWTDIARRYWRRAGLEDRIELRLGPASDTLRQLLEEGMEGRFGLAFVDADKASYPDYFRLCRRLVRPGGLIVLDNAFMGGRVMDPAPSGPAAEVAGLTDAVYGDPGLEPVLIPMGDGILVVQNG
jgi:predicted O-methyltransferase YrrM